MILNFACSRAPDKLNFSGENIVATQHMLGEWEDDEKENNLIYFGVNVYGAPSVTKKR